ncbi:hypothetical protein [Pengzhenrongella sp.]|jgi:hypothetical protein|uniref:hypothetical protein n=1 Tax=Pengzhenrongella sp. TaxID=2888820 RepID=UPI002F9462E5
MSKKIDPRSSGQLPIPDLHRLGCTAYIAGHNVHWIQALHTSDKSEVSAQSWRGQLVTVDGEVLTVRKPEDHLIRFRNHDPARLVAVLERTGVDVLINDQYAILRVGSFCFSIKADSGEPLGPCPIDQLPPNLTAEQIVARVRTHGGFSLDPRDEVGLAG